MAIKIAGYVQSGFRNGAYFLCWVSKVIKTYDSVQYWLPRILTSIAVFIVQGSFNMGCDIVEPKQYMGLYVSNIWVCINQSVNLAYGSRYGRIWWESKIRKIGWSEKMQTKEASTWIDVSICRNRKPCKIIWAMILNNRFHR